MPAVRRSGFVALVASCCLALSACTGSDGDGDPSASAASPGGTATPLPTGDPTDQSPDVAFTPCGGTGFACTGESEGFPYDIRLPRTWNGTLLIYSHGLRPQDAIEANEDFTPIAEAAPGLAGGASVVADGLLEEGYALVGAGSPQGGWSIDEALQSVAQAREVFVQNVGVPNRIYTWGQSLGGLVSIRSQQTRPWVNGSASLCGLLGGLNPNMDLALDVAFGVKALIDPRLILTGYSSATQARKEFRRAIAALQAAADDPTGQGLAKLRVIAAMTETPTRTRTSSGLGPEKLGTALVENLGRLLARSTLERYGVEQQYGGNPSTNVGVNYGARVTGEEAIEIDATVGSGTTLSLLREIASQPAVEADSRAREAAAADYPAPSALDRPIVSIHTAEDPLAILANETLFGSRAANVSGQEIRWLNINVSQPPVPFPDEGGAAYGVGHCNFTAGTLVGVVQVLDDWVRLGRFPTWAGNSEAFGPNSGFAGPAALPAWPDSPTTSGQ
jgi:hypothetical protein